MSSRSNIPHIKASRILLSPLYQVTWKAASFEYSSEQKSILWHVQNVVQSALPLGSYDSGDPMV